MDKISQTRTVIGSAVAVEEHDLMICAERVNWTQVAESTLGSKRAHCIAPLEDPRWAEFVLRHPRASVFHSCAWLEALSRTYGYTPVAYTTSPPGQGLGNGIVFCRINSWMTGRRLVSLPFSDHCEPLVDKADDVKVLSAAIEKESRDNQWQYVEIRPRGPFEMVAWFHHAEMMYSFHELDLRADIDRLFGKFHKSSTQRKIRRAEREGLKYLEGSDQSLLSHFYGLLTTTRKRHKLPPQPRKWFVNLMDCFGDALKIRVAFKIDRPVAAMLTLRYKDTMVYKYGCSDPRFNNLGGMHLLYWKSIQEAQKSGLSFFDFGRTDADQQGLITFKNRWGATHSKLIYSRYGASQRAAHFSELSSGKWKSKVAKSVLAHLPPRILSMVGEIMYRHVG